LDETDYIQVTKNYYALRREWFAMDLQARHLDFCTCVAKRRKNLLFTDQSACAIRQIPRQDLYEIRPHCISETRKPSDVIRWHYGSRDPKASIIDGFLVASPMRIICDMANSDSPESLLRAINHCLYKKSFTKKQLLQELEKQPSHMHGKKLIRRLLRFATPQCESPLETLAWIAIYKAGFVMPQQQIGIDGDQSFFARVDMFWKLPSGTKLVLELDGMLKYEESGSLKAEKIREDTLRKMGYEVARATWSDVMEGSLVPMLIDRKVPLRRDFTGTFPKRER
jgi:very-short-patch-repair endonuclease